MRADLSKTEDTLLIFHCMRLTYENVAEIEYHGCKLNICSIEESVTCDVFYAQGGAGPGGKRGVHDQGDYGSTCHIQDSQFPDHSLQGTAFNGQPLYLLKANRWIRMIVHMFNYLRKYSPLHSLLDILTGE